MLAVVRDLNWDSQPEHLHVAPTCVLSFLTIWQLQISILMWWLRVSREPGGSSITSDDQSLEATASLPSYSTGHPVTKGSPDSKNGDTDPTSQ